MSKHARFLFSLILIGYVALTHTQPAKAEEFSLKLTPPILQIEANPPVNIRTPFTIENQGNDSLDLQISFNVFQADGEYGHIQYRLEHDKADEELLKKIQIVDNEGFAIDSLSLGPKQKKTLDLRMYLPKNEPANDYYFSITFINKNKQAATQNKNTQDKQSNTSFIEAGIAMNVLLSVGVQEAPQDYIEEFSVPFYLESGPVPFTVRMKNTGRHLISPRGTILITNMFGQTIGKVDLPQTNILAGTIRSLNNGKMPQAGTTKDQGPKAVWTEKFLLGFYTAKLILEEGSSNYNKSVHFIAFPIKFLFATIIGIILLTIIIIRLRTKLKEA